MSYDLSLTRFLDGRKPAPEMVKRTETLAFMVHRIVNPENWSPEAVAVNTAGWAETCSFHCSSPASPPLLPVPLGWTGPAGRVYQAEEEGV